MITQKEASKVILDLFPEATVKIKHVIQETIIELYNLSKNDKNVALDALSEFAMNKYHKYNPKKEMIYENGKPYKKRKCYPRYK